MTTSSIGASLREARTKKAVSLEEVHAKIKIHPRVLDLLEKDQFEKLPSPLFVKSFLKSYSEFLEISPREILAAYEQRGAKNPEQILFLKPSDPRSKRFTGLGPRIFSTLIGIAAVAAACVVIFYLTKAASHLRFRHSLLPKTALTPKSGRVKAVDQKSVSKIDAEWLRRPEYGNFPTLSNKTPLELKVKAIENVWIKIKADGKTLFEGTLKRGSSEAWTAGTSIEIWTGNASNTFLTLNQTPIGSPGRGVIRRMLISHQGIRVVPEGKK